MTDFLLNLLDLYQHYFSPDHSAWGKWRYPYGYCRFQPTCSEFAKQAILAHGVFGGSGKALMRLLRCNPFSTPAIDPVAKKSP